MRKNLLKEVSRSFYLSFLALPPDVRPTMSVGYLFCRAADTIADTPTIPLEEKQKQLAHFKRIFSRFPVELAPLQELLQSIGYAACVADFNKLERTDQSLVQSVVTAVITGMEIDLKIFGDPSGEEKPIVRVLPTEKDLETYIHWIGGEPGRFWANVCLARLRGLRIQNPDQWTQDAIVFGTGLQMVNILRDLPADLKMGRCYIPQELLRQHELSVDDFATSEKEDVFRTLFVDLIDQTMFRLGRGLSYINQLPAGSLGLRAAAALPMLIGAKTLRRLRESPSIFKTGSPIKISRAEIYGLVGSTFFCLPSDRMLKRKFEKESGA